jgi:hypothetical protein
MEQAQRLEPLQRIGDGAAAYSGLLGDVVVGGIKLSRCIVEELEQQHAEHFQRCSANRPAVLPRLVRLAVESLGLVPALRGFLLR